MIDRSGILKNSPLVFALAAIRFTSWPLMTKKIDEIHDELRETLPIILKIRMQQIGPNNQAVNLNESLQPSAWLLVSSDHSHGIQLSPDQLLVFSKKYERYADFETNLKMYLDVLLKHMRLIINVTNCGARYIDRIKVADNELFDKYISNTLLPAKFQKLEPTGGVCISSYKSGGADLRVRCISEPEALSFPDDLVPLLAMTQEQGKPFEIEQLNRNQFILDIDAFKNYAVSARMDSDAILEQLKSLHNVANAFFRHEDVCTPHAFRVWKG